MTKSEIEPYENLANAIIEQAAKDYEDALITLSLDLDNYQAKRMKKDCELFFREDISFYSSLDGEEIMKGIRRNVKYGC